MNVLDGIVEKENTIIKTVQMLNAGGIKHLLMEQRRSETDSGNCSHSMELHVTER